VLGTIKKYVVSSIFFLFLALGNGIIYLNKRPKERLNSND
jgi:hypothetical protein